MYDPYPQLSSLDSLRSVARSRDYSNNVLISNDEDVYFLPTYLRVVFMEVENINIQELTADFLCTLIITIYYKNLPPELVQELKVIEFSARNVQTVTLRGSGESKNAVIRNNTQNQTMEYLFRGNLPLRLECDVQMAPYEVIDFKLLLVFHAILVNKNNMRASIKFNFMDIHDLESKCLLLYKDSNVSGYYGLAESSLGVEFSAVRISSQGEEANYFFEQLDPETLRAHRMLDNQTYKTFGGLIYDARVKNWRFVTYGFKMYRYPVNTIVIVFVPLWIMSFVGLVIFWADPDDVSGKLQTISGLIIAYAALLPTIRDKIPPSPQITLLEYLVYSLAFCTFLASLETLLASLNFQSDGVYDFVWSRNWRFLLSMVIIISTMVIIAFLTIIYKCVWEPRYNFTKPKRFGVEFEDYKINTEAWFNVSASEYLKSHTTIVQPTIQGRFQGNNTTVIPARELTQKPFTSPGPISSLTRGVSPSGFSNRVPNNTNGFLRNGHDGSQFPPPPNLQGNVSPKAFDSQNISGNQGGNFRSTENGDNSGDNQPSAKIQPTSKGQSHMPSGIPKWTSPGVHNPSIPKQVPIMSGVSDVRSQNGHLAGTGVRNPNTPRNYNPDAH